MIEGKRATAGSFTVVFPVNGKAVLYDRGKDDIDHDV